MTTNGLLAAEHIHHQLTTVLAALNHITRELNNLPTTADGLAVTHIRYRIDQAERDLVSAAYTVTALHGTIQDGETPR